MRLNKSARGFTLLELLIATAILSAIALFLASLLGTVNRAWVAGEQQVSEFQDGRAICELMSRELSQAVISPRLQFIQNPGSLDTLLTGSTTQVANSDAIFFQTVSSGSDPLGNVNEVGYYLTHRTDSAGNEHFELQRLSVPPTDPSQPLGTIKPNPAYHIYDSPSPVVYNTSATSIMPSWINLNGTAFSGSTRKDFEYFSTTVSDGVIGLWIRCLDGNGDLIPWLSSADGSTAPIKFNSTAHFQSSIPGQSASFKYTSPTTTAQANLLPAVLEISVITLDPQTFKRNPVIPGLPTWTDPSELPAIRSSFGQQLVANNIKTARLFTKRVKLMNSTQ